MFAANVDVVVNGVLGQVGAVDILLEALVAFLSRGGGLDWLTVNFHGVQSKKKTKSNFLNPCLVYSIIKTMGACAAWKTQSHTHPLYQPYNTPPNTRSARRASGNQGRCRFIC